MLNKIAALLFIYYGQDLRNEEIPGSFADFSKLIVISSICGIFIYFLNLYATKSKKPKQVSIVMVAEIVTCIITLAAIIIYTYQYLTLSYFRDIQVMIGMIILWLVECALYTQLSEIGLQGILTTFLTSNIILLIGEILLRQQANYAIIFEFTTLNILILCAQMAQGGWEQLQDKDQKNLFVTVSRQDCFRLMVYFLVFLIVNDSIKACQKGSLMTLVPLAIITPLYIYAAAKFNQRRYCNAGICYIVCLATAGYAQYYVK